MANLTCPHCGTANRIGSNFCNKCGTDLREEEVPASTIDDAVPTAAIARAAEMAAEQMAASPDEADENDAKDGESARNLEAEAGGEAPPAPLPPLFDLGSGIDHIHPRR